MNIQKSLEVIADIAYQAGRQNFFTGDSRADISEFLFWADQFEKENVHADWDSEDYILAIETFTSMKIKEASSLHPSTYRRNGGRPI